MDLEELKASNCIIFECISGSNAYGLSIETSDEDIRGVFIAPRDKFYGFDYQEQIHDEKHNIVYYEVRKFLELLAKNNPNMLELLDIPQDCILYKHPLYDEIKPQFFLSMLCKDTFLNYASSQFKKAWGLNKKILNPMSKDHKSILDFCYILNGCNSIPLPHFLKDQNLLAKNCGLIAIAHMRDLFALFYNADGSYQGIARHEGSMDVSLSSIPNGQVPIATLSFNKDGYSTYCKDYKEYWSWVENRNQDRFENTIEHGKNYDSKNMMHLFRLLLLAESIGRKGALEIRTPYREELLKIRRGEFSYQELVDKMTIKIEELENVFTDTHLPEKPNIPAINELLVNLRIQFYKLNSTSQD